ncbi:MAG TPA: pyridoxal-5'-phosphate-dependent protein, partial [Rhodospirillaceae bacterium]|nr:pyridoxal-5'-phosphate-dependent protein [Rhodospirillaceae bacterium]
GTALALSNLCPDVPIYSAEPADFNDTARSLTSGERESVSPDARSICDALLTPTPGVITFALNQALLSGGLSVTDKEALAAMRTAFLDLKLVVEPGGAVALASILSGKLPPGDDPVVAVLSGGNVDPETFQAALQI